MILQRLASALRRQDWFQVVIEVMIVVIGIFLGLQVQAWYEEKQAVADEERIIGYLINDVEDTISMWDGQNRFHDNNLREGRIVLAALERGKILPGEREGFERGLNVIGKTSTIKPYLNSFTEENLNRIQSNELRRIIDDYLGRKEREGEIISHIISNLDTAMEAVMTKTSVTDIGDAHPHAIYDFEQLKNDFEFKAAFASVQARVGAIMFRYSRAINNTRVLRDALKQYQTYGTIMQVEFEGNVRQENLQ